KYSQAHRARTRLWNLPRPSTLRPRSRRQDLQAEVRASRLESSREKSPYRTGGNHRAESRFRRGSRLAPFARSGDHPRQPERSHQRGHAPQKVPAVQRAVSPGSLARAARFALFVYAVHGHDEGMAPAREFAEMKAAHTTHA